MLPRSGCRRRGTSRYAAPQTWAMKIRWADRIRTGRLKRLFGLARKCPAQPAQPAKWRTLPSLPLHR
jgi:hypothetical protein